MPDGTLFRDMEGAKLTLHHIAVLKLTFVLSITAISFICLLNLEVLDHSPEQPDCKAKYNESDQAHKNLYNKSSVADNTVPV